MWYHDPALGINRLNIFAGLLGIFFVRDEQEDLLKLPRGKYEVPLVIYDRPQCAGTARPSALRQSEIPMGSGHSPAMQGGALWTHDSLGDILARTRYLAATEGYDKEHFFSLG